MTFDVDLSDLSHWNKQFHYVEELTVFFEYYETPPLHSYTIKIKF